MSEESPTARLAFVDLAAQQARLRPGLDAALARVLDGGAYLMGPEVDELEAALAGRSGVAHAVACSSGTDALVLTLMALGVGPGDAVVVPAFTFVATAGAVALAGATPLLADVGANGNLGPDQVEAAIAAGRDAGHDPVGVITVDLFGHPSDHEAIAGAAGERWLVVDAAQSFGARRSGRPVGGTGVATTTSFYPAKPLGCYGDGGAVLTDDADRAAVLRSLRSHGQGGDRYDAVRVGMNGRIDSLQAAVLLQKLTVFDDELARRREVAARYSAGLDGLVRVPGVEPGVEPTWAQYTIEDDDRDELAAALDRAGIPTAVHYPRPLHHQEAYRQAPRAVSLAEAERLSGVVLSLPLHPYLSDADQDRVVAAVKEARA